MRTTDQKPPNNETPPSSGLSFARKSSNVDGGSVSTTYPTIRTDPQCIPMCVYLYTLAGKRGISHDEVRQQIKSDYGAESAKDLTLAQYKIVKKQLLALPKLEALV